LESDGKSGVGLVDADAVADLEELVTFAEVIEADPGGFVGGGFGLEVVFDEDAVFLLLEDADVEGFGGRDDVVLYAVFDEELEAEGGDLMVKAIRPDIDVDMEEGFEAGLEHVHVGSQEFKLFAEGDGLAGILAEQLAVEIRQLENEWFGAVVFLADHDAERAEGVKEEMGVDLLFEDFEAGAEIFVLKLRVGEQDILLFREGSEGGLDGKDDQGGKGQLDEGKGVIGVDINMEVVKEVDEADKGDDEDEVDEGLDGKAEGGAGFGGAFVGGEPLGVVEAVGDPLVDGPEEQEEDKTDDPGADDAAGLDVSGEDVVVEQADSRHEEGAEKGEEYFSPGGSVFGGRCWQLGVLAVGCFGAPEDIKK
jgi:hypothetical protein